MTNDKLSERNGLSRRELLTCGSGATVAAVVGRPRGVEASSRSASLPSRTEPVRGVMYSYQYAPGPCTVAEPNLDWRPRTLDPSYRTHVVTYDRSPSLRALVFAESDPTRRSGSPVLASSERPLREPGLQPLTEVDLTFE